MEGMRRVMQRAGTLDVLGLSQTKVLAWLAQQRAGASITLMSVATRFPTLAIADAAMLRAAEVSQSSQLYMSTPFALRPATTQLDVLAYLLHQRTFASSTAEDYSSMLKSALLSLSISMMASSPEGDLSSLMQMSQSSLPRAYSALPVNEKSTMWALVRYVSLWSRAPVPLDMHPTWKRHVADACDAVAAADEPVTTHALVSALIRKLQGIPDFATPLSHETAADAVKLDWDAAAHTFRLSVMSDGPGRIASDVDTRSAPQRALEGRQWLGSLLRLWRLIETGLPRPAPSAQLGYV